MSTAADDPEGTPGEGGEPGLSPRDHAIDVTPAAEPAEQPADVEPDDCDGELFVVVG